MTCEAALCAIARSCAANLKHHAPAAARGDADAVHHLRLALTRLRTAIRFFAPAIDDPAWTSVLLHASWLGRQSGPARDVDVALERQRRKGAAQERTKRWRQERDRLYAQLRRSLRSSRYRRFIDSLSKRSNLPPDNPGDQSSADGFSTQRLERWRRKLLKRARKLDRLSEQKRHRLRLRAKRFRYALEWSLPLLTEGRALKREEIRQAKAIQDALGPLNDCFTHQAQARALNIDPLPSMVRLGREKAQTRRLKSAGRAFEKLARLH
jgi:CHAD domain-containing protein